MNQQETWPRQHRLTVEEYHRMAEVGILPPEAQVELIEGEIIDMPPIGNRHASAVDRLAKRFILAVGESAFIRIQGPVRLGTRSEPQPGLAVLRPRPDEYRDSPPAAADVLLVVEISDATLRYDRDVKSKLYARHGIPELWLIDLEHKQLHVFRKPLQGDWHQSLLECAGILRIPTLGIPIDLTGL